jgi:hypothetical protein
MRIDFFESLEMDTEEIRRIYLSRAEEASPISKEALLLPWDA